MASYNLENKYVALFVNIIRCISLAVSDLRSETKGFQLKSSH